MLFPAPPVPAAFPSDQTTTYRDFIRYEDCTQDGRLIPLAIPPVLGGLWQNVITKHPGSRNSIAKGVIPILTRLTLRSEEQAIRIDREIETTSGFELAHQLEGGAVSRLFMLVWSSVHGMAGRVGPRQVDAEMALAGTLFAEHTFTRLFAPPDQRRVTSLPYEGYPELPAMRYDAPDPKSAQEPIAGGSWLDELVADPAEIAFTLDQTDANQHVNSMVYIRLYIEAVQRRLAATGRSLKVRSNAVDIAYRKPCFAGDRVRSHVRLFEHAAGIGAAGHVTGDDGKPRCYVRVLFAD